MTPQASIIDTMDLVRQLQPLEEDGWIVGACGSTLRRGIGEDIDILLVREPDSETSGALKETLEDCGLRNVREHLGPDGIPDGLGYTAEWEGIMVDVGVTQC